MGWNLCSARREQRGDLISRFDPRFWTVNFPRPMMASVVTTAPDALRVDTVFYKADDLAGLIWEAEDRFDHPLLAYQTARDFRGCRLSFRWRSGGVRALDAVNGPVLTIEGRDAAGRARAWYVRLWNYAVGTREDAVVSIDFARVDGGFLLPGEADPVWAGDVDRMFVSLVAPGYTGADAPLAAPAEGWVELTGIACDGPGAVIAIGDAVLPEHDCRIASGYDDSYNLTPARLLRNALHLGYRGAITHYVGMSHYFRLEALGGGFYASLAGGVLNAPCVAWHRAFATQARALDVMAHGVGDGIEGVTASVLITGASVRPPMPVGARQHRLADGRVAIAWTRRSRAGWRWLDGVDVPLGEEREAYRVSVNGTEVDTAEPRLDVDAPPGTVVTIRQRGTLAESPPLMLTIT